MEAERAVSGEQRAVKVPVEASRLVGAVAVEDHGDGEWRERGPAWVGEARAGGLAAELTRRKIVTCRTAFRKA